ncbi:MAG: site-specific integrase [Heliobacteriaceae bacterium]|nr:site-specific integrase [Heliobacteriaceae bacterium]
MNVVEPIRNRKELKRIEAILARNQQTGGRDLLFFVLGTNSGLRISDILGLDVGSVKCKHHIDIIEKKTGKYKRFPVNSKLMPLISAFVHGRDDDEPLFMTRFNHRLDRVQAYRIINRACRTAGITCRVGTHTLRKTFGYHHYRQFKDVAILQKIFNHSSPAITLKYIGIDQDKIDESYSKFIL